MLQSTEVSRLSVKLEKVLRLYAKATTPGEKAAAAAAAHRLQIKIHALNQYKKATVREFQFPIFE